MKNALSSKTCLLPCLIVLLVSQFLMIGVHVRQWLKMITNWPDPSPAEPVILMVTILLLYFAHGIALSLFLLGIYFRIFSMPPMPPIES